MWIIDLPLSVRIRIPPPALLSLVSHLDLRPIKPETRPVSNTYPSPKRQESETPANANRKFMLCATHFMTFVFENITALWHERRAPDEPA